MRKIQVEITGVTPLLMNNPASMLEESSGSSSRTAKRDYKADADKLAYKLKDGTLFVPAEAIKGTIINASAYMKFGKYSAKPMIAGGVIISPRQISLNTKKYDLDVRTVVIQRARVPKARPMLENWKINFEIEYDETLISSGDLLKPILEDAGKRVGLLDFRPQKFGNFGTFKVTKWQEK